MSNDNSKKGKILCFGRSYQWYNRHTTHDIWVKVVRMNRHIYWFFANSRFNLANAAKLRSRWRQRSLCLSRGMRSIICWWIFSIWKELFCKFLRIDNICEIDYLVKGVKGYFRGIFITKVCGNYGILQPCHDYNVCVWQKFRQINIILKKYINTVFPLLEAAASNFFQGLGVRP